MRIIFIQREGDFLQSDLQGYKRKIGALGEKMAREYLREVEGYRIIAQNYTCPLGEIDIIALDQEALVFIEVRTSGVSVTNLAEASVGFRKQKKLRQLAAYYLKEKRLGDCLSRFDVVIVKLEQGSFAVREIKLLKDAF